MQTMTLTDAKITTLRDALELARKKYLAKTLRRSFPSSPGGRYA